MKDASDEDVGYMYIDRYYIFTYSSIILRVSSMHYL